MRRMNPVISTIAALLVSSAAQAQTTWRVSDDTLTGGSSREFAGLPPNDGCEGAVSLGVPSIAQGTTVGATPDSAGFCAIANTSPGVWYSVMGTGNRMTAHLCDTVLIDPGFDTSLSVYCAGCEWLTCVTGNDDIVGCGWRSRVEWCSAAGTEYLILVHGYRDEAGEFILDISDDGTPCASPPDCDVPVCGDGEIGRGEECDDGNIDPGDGCDENCRIEPPDNDDCVNAIAISERDMPVLFDSTAATTDGPAHASCLFSGNNKVDNDIWYDYTAECTGTATVETCGSSYDTKLVAYNGCDCPVSDEVKMSCDDNTCGSQSRLSLATIEDHCYKIRVGSDGDGTSDTGPGVLTITCVGVVSNGACCRRGACLGTMIEEDCDFWGGDWFIGEDCDDPDFVCVPPNDECEGRSLLGCNASMIVDNSAATNNPEDPAAGCWLDHIAEGTVFLQFIAAADSARIRTDTAIIPPAEDSEFAVYAVDQGDVCDKGAWVEIGCSADEGVGFNGDICVEGLAVGNIYIVELGSYTVSDRGEYTLDLACPCAGGPGPDCNGNGVPDDQDIGGSASRDCNSDGVPDECEVPPLCPACPDCNTNAIPDECEVPPICSACSDGNGNGIPDECDPCWPPTEIVHGTAAPGETWPCTGYIDCRLESDDGVNVNQGVIEVTVVFDGPVFSAGGGPVGPGDFEVTETGWADPPNVAAVEQITETIYRVTLDRIITLQEWTTIRAFVEDECRIPIQSLGDLGPGAPEPDRIDIGYLPGDFNQSGMVSPEDLLSFRQFLSAGIHHNECADALYADIDRDGILREPQDLLRFRQMITGTPPATRSWTLKEMNSTQP